MPCFVGFSFFNDFRLHRKKAREPSRGIAVFLPCGVTYLPPVVRGIYRSLLFSPTEGVSVCPRNARSDEEAPITCDFFICSFAFLFNERNVCISLSSFRESSFVFCPLGDAVIAGRNEDRSERKRGGRYSASFSKTSVSWAGGCLSVSLICEAIQCD